MDNPTQPLSSIATNTWSKYRFLLIWVVALLSATGYYGLNRLAIDRLRANEPIAAWLNGKATVVSVDDEYYVSPPENWLAGRGWRRSPPLGHGSYVRRTPGYSLWYLAHRLAAGPGAVYLALLLSQIVVFAFAAVAFAATVRRVVRTAWVRTAVTGVFVLSPWFLSYSFFSITEALSVPLLVFGLYYTCRAYQTTTPTVKAWAYAASAAFWSMATLTRPFAGLAVFLLVVMMSADYLLRPATAKWSLFFRNALLSGIIPLLFFGSWAGRNYLVTGEVVLLERYSHPESIDGYKPAFNAIWDLYVASGVKQSDFYQGVPQMYGLLHTTAQPDSALLEKSLAIIPADKRAAMGGDPSLRAALQAYQRLLTEQYYPFVAHPVRPMPAVYSAQEIAVVQQFNDLRQQLYLRQPQMRLISPLLVLKEAVGHSNTSNMSLFDQRIRSEYWPLNVLRLLLLAIHVALYAGLAVSWIQVLRKRATLLHLGLILPPTLLLLALAFWVGTTEQRYMLPFLSFLLLNAALLVDGFRQSSATSSLG